MRAMVATGAMVLAASPVLSAELGCHDLAETKASIMTVPKAQWVELTDLQRAFLAGIYAMNPITPPGLPYGDKAALAREAGGDGSGMVFFLDGDLACQPMPIPAELGEMLRAIGAGDVTHEPKL